MNKPLTEKTLAKVLWPWPMGTKHAKEDLAEGHGCCVELKRRRKCRGAGDPTDGNPVATFLSITC